MAPRRTGLAASEAPGPLGAYRLEDQVGFLLRKASQRHAALFASGMASGLTPTQWAALVKVADMGHASQNRLGRETAMDAATIKGVVDRLLKRHLVTAVPDPADARRSLISLTPLGAQAVADAIPAAFSITAETLDGLTPAEQRTLLALLRRIG